MTGKLPCDYADASLSGTWAREGSVLRAVGVDYYHADVTHCLHDRRTVLCTESQG
jgi:hypothetical protein